MPDTVPREPNGQIGKSLQSTGADIGYLGAVIGKLVSDPATYSAAARSLTGSYLNNERENWKAYLMGDR